MKKYLVFYTETREYSMQIEAADEEDAQEKFMAIPHQEALKQSDFCKSEFDDIRHVQELE